jgi:3-oxoacyl-[acyl-carrier protein] reductase
LIEIDLSDKNVLITGGTRGIGRAISLTLARAGARIGAIYRGDAATAARTLEELNALPGCGEHFAVQADIADEVQATEATLEVIQRFEGAIDILVLDAAAGAGGPMIGMKTEEWKRPFDVNVHGAFYVVRTAANSLRPGASVIFLSSGAGHDYMEGLSSYGASKAAVNHMSGILAQELGPKGVRVNTVSPGHTLKEITEPGVNPPELTEGQRGIVATTALRRMGNGGDVANVVLFFASDLSGFVTGQWVRVNGGRI